MKMNNNEGKGQTQNKHTHEPLEPVECDIILMNIEIQSLISTNPTTSIKNIYNQKEIELTIKYGSQLVAKHWPEFDSKDSGLFKRKNKLVPKLPSSIEDLTDLPEDYKLTITKQRFLASPIELFSIDVAKVLLSALYNVWKI